MRGVVYDYPLKKNFKLHRFFVAYLSNSRGYVEENFDTREECETRQRHLKKRLSNKNVVIYSRERAEPAGKLRKPKHR